MRELNGNIDTVEKSAKEIIVGLCQEFYRLGWMTGQIKQMNRGCDGLRLLGTGGAISMKTADSDILITPSGVLKESVKEDDIFTLDCEGQIITRPVSSHLKFSSCFPNFQHIFRLR